MKHFKYSKDREEIVDVIVAVSHERRLLQELLADLLTPAEHRELAIRWQIVKQLHRGLPHRQVAKNLKVSVATVSRGARALADSRGGFRRALSKLNKK